MNIILDTSEGRLKVLGPLFCSARQTVRIIRQDGDAFDDSANHRLSLFAGSQILAYGDCATDGTGDYALTGSIDTHTSEALAYFAAAGNPEQMKCAVSLQKISEALAPLELLGRADSIIRYNGYAGTAPQISGTWYYGAADCTAGSDVVQVVFPAAIAIAPNGVITLTVSAQAGGAQIVASVDGAITTAGFTARLSAAAGVGYKLFWTLAGALE